jgi:hypothetical protein
MIHQKYRFLAQGLSCAAILLSLIGCERETYTSWNCRSTDQVKIPMVLRKAQMEFQGQALKYCGSLGNQSYFDQSCTNQTEQSNTAFTPNTGLLIQRDKEYQCIAL